MNSIILFLAVIIVIAIIANLIGKLHPSYSYNKAIQWKQERVSLFHKFKRLQRF